MKNRVRILREGISKRGEKRVAVTPGYAKEIVEWGHKLIVQPREHPETKEIKRVFKDDDYEKTGAIISEELSECDVIFGLKEIDIQNILSEKTYLFFSHTHKGQKKNRKMLKALVDKKTTLIDYELITGAQNQRVITAFTFYAGYAGMIDSLWTLGKRLKLEGVENPFEKIPQSIEKEDLTAVKNIVKNVGEGIKTNGTPEEIPPVITCFLGRGKTSHGAQEIYDLLPVEEITLDQLEDVYKTGSKNRVYKIVLEVYDMYKFKSDANIAKDEYKKLTETEKINHYISNPDFYETNLDKYLPFITLLMNCIIWSSEYPRVLPKSLMKEIYQNHKTLKVIGDITCDPNGSIEFSKETWIDNPVYIYNPIDEILTDGFDGEGIAVMAVTNLPCEFSADASKQFSDDLYPLLKGIVAADYKGTIEESNLPEEIKRAVILWKGEFTGNYFYMKEYVR